MLFFHSSRLFPGRLALLPGVLLGMLLGVTGCGDELDDVGNGSNRIQLREDGNTYNLEPAGFEADNPNQQDTFALYIGPDISPNADVPNRYLVFNIPRFHGQGVYPIGLGNNNQSDTTLLHYIIEGDTFRAYTGELDIIQHGVLQDTLESGELYDRTFSLSGEFWFQANRSGQTRTASGSFINLRSWSR